MLTALESFHITLFTCIALIMMLKLRWSHNWKKIYIWSHKIFSPSFLIRTIFKLVPVMCQVFYFFFIIYSHKINIFEFTYIPFNVFSCIRLILKIYYYWCHDTIILKVENIYSFILFSDETCVYFFLKLCKMDKTKDPDKASEGQNKNS